MLSHDEMEFLRNLTGKEVSAFQLNNNLEFSAKTQRWLYLSFLFISILLYLFFKSPVYFLLI